jgi:hypothetical protein
MEEMKERVENLTTATKKEKKHVPVSDFNNAVQ